MRELSLFTGAGGGLLGTLLLGWRPIGYVEFNEYCQRVIAQRIADGILPAAPIFGDVREFVQSGAAAEYRGFADVVTGGFPCQPFSVAGKRAGADDPRNMWPATLATVRAARPRYCFFENVPGLLASGYFERILCDLTESGYGVRWRCLSAAELGAPHKRDRLWIVAYSKCVNGGSESQQSFSGSGETRDKSSRGSTKMAYATNTNDPDHRRGQGQNKFRRNSGTKSKTWFAIEPNVGRVAHGVAARVDRLRSLGNGQVPAVVAAAWHLLTGD